MITWSEIETECGDYRAGFVAIFRKYEGQPTDEKTEQGRPVKVTVASFARHAGIAERTFRRWVDAAIVAVSPEARDQWNAKEARNRARTLPPEEKAKLAADLISEPDVAEQVVSQPETRRSINRATDVHDRRKAEQRAQRTEKIENQDQVGKRIDNLKAVTELGEVHERYSRDGNEALRRIGELPDSERYWLTGAVDRAEATLRAARRYLELGRSEIDAELDHIIKNGG
jgi:hypothetical protein